MGPTASGKTNLAVWLVQHFPFEIISVDSAMVYRGMNIGTAKPEPEILAKAPHHLIDIRDPAEPYSAAQFREDALREIDKIIARKKIPLLVGGTMLYFRALQQGLSDLPSADPTVRAKLNAEGEQQGWVILHKRLEEVDPIAAQRIHPHDAQRIQRALEVFELTGKSLSSWQLENSPLPETLQMINIAIAPQDRSVLHERIAMRFDKMLSDGFIEEVKQLFYRGNLNLDMPSIRSVGYRQAWDYFRGNLTYDQMREKGVIATRQLAKRQLTWLRSWPEMAPFDGESKNLCQDIVSYLTSLNIITP